MYVVLVTNKKKDVFSDIMPEMKEKFPGELFTIFGSEEKGYQLRIEGLGDEKAPRKFAEKFIKTWKPKDKEEPIVAVTELTVANL